MWTWRQIQEGQTREWSLRRCWSTFDISSQKLAFLPHQNHIWTFQVVSHFDQVQLRARATVMSTQPYSQPGWFSELAILVLLVLLFQVWLFLLMWLCGARAELWHCVAPNLILPTVDKLTKVVLLGKAGLRQPPPEGLKIWWKKRDGDQFADRPGIFILHLYVDNQLR